VMTFVWLTILVSVVALAHLILVGRFAGILTLDGIFVLTQWVMATGTLVILDSGFSADRLYAFVVAVPFVLYVATSITFFYYRRRNASTALRSSFGRAITYYRPSRVFWALLALSVVITITYYQAVGYNTLMLGLKGILTGTTADYTTLRLDSYSSGGYLFPGYVNQFKNTVLPSLTLVASLYLIKNRKSWRYLVIVPLVPMSIYGILGTGQRGAFILFGATLIVFIYVFDRRRFLSRATVTVALASPLVLVITYMLGRSASSLTRDSGPFEKLSTLIVELVRRLFYDNQYSGQQAFRYTYSLPIQYGKEWYQSFLGILPNNSGSELAHQVFESVYGSDRGTSPPSMWGSVFYNFGWWGTIALPVVLAIGFQLVSIHAMAKRQVSTLELVGMSGTFVVAGSWIAGDPLYLLNAGAATFAMIWWWGRAASSRQPSGSGNASEWREPGGTTSAVPRAGEGSVPGSVPAVPIDGPDQGSRVLVVTLDAYRYSTRARKAARQYLTVAPTQFIGVSGVGRTGRWDVSGDFAVDGVSITQVRARRPWVAPSRTSQARNAIFSYGPALFRLARAVMRTPAGTVHVVGAPLALIGVAHRRKYASRFVLDINERPGAVAARGSLMSVFSRFESALLKGVGKHVDLATVVTYGDVDTVTEMGFRQVKLVRNVPIATWRASYSRPVWDAGDTPTLVVVGTIFEGRGYEILLKSLAKVAGTRHVRLKIYGGGRDDYVSSLKRLAATLGISESVEWMGRIDSSEVSAAYLDAHVGLVLYEKVDPGNDGLSNKILECVATGRPVIASDLSENRRFVNENHVGWLADVSPDGLAGAIRELPVGADFEEISARCRLLGDTWLNWESEFAQVIDALKLGGPGRSSTGRV